MLISYKKKFIFLKTIKTAGTSVEIYLETWCVPEGEKATHQTHERVTNAGIVGFRGAVPEGTRYYNHAPAAYIREEVGEHIWSQYHKITCIRNPFDKMISAFWMFSPHVSKDDPFEKVFSAFSKYISDEAFPDDRAIYTLNGEPCCDSYIRYEHLLQDLREVCARIDVPFDPARLGRYKSGLRALTFPIQAYYSEESAAKVREYYAAEFDWFGYSLDPARAGPS